MNKFSFVATLSVLALGQVSYAAIEFWARDRNGSTTPVQITGAVGSGNAVTITTTALSSNTGNSTSTEWIVWVFDTDATTTDPDEHIGSITIDASGGDFNSTIRLLVAPAPLTGATRSQPDFEASPATDIPPGAVNLGPISITPSTYENAVAASIAVTGDVGSSSASPRDQITVGQMFRLQANGRNVSGSLVGGNIYADVTAKTYAGQPHSAGNMAIGEVTAAKSIRGNIVALGDVTEDDENANIDTVRVTLAAETDPGITGDIKAERGVIKSIITTGKIGTNSTSRSQIRAGHGIFEVKADLSPPDPVTQEQQLLAVDFFADIKANIVGVVDNSSFLARSLNKLETAGDYEGTIEADFIRPPAGVGSPGVEWGVFVGGEFRGVVDVRSVISASIGAATFAPPDSSHPDWGTIKIDHALHGAVVATASNGQIPIISIGRSPFLSTGGSLPIRFGFLGSNSDPQTLPFTPWNPAPAGPDTPDSVIAAASIGYVTISHMLRVDKSFVPRIEAPEIGTLIIDDMREGVVWSGEIEYVLDTEGEVVLSGGRPVLADPQERSNDYSEIGSIEIGCIGPGADVWFKSTPQATVSGNMLGEFYLPALASAEKIWIGERLGTGGGEEPVDDCPCNFASPNGQDDCALRTDGGWPTEGVTDFTPRRMLGEEIAEVGAVRIASPTGLAGQVIIRRLVGDQTDAQAWSGKVIVGDGTGTPVVLAPESDSPDEAPYYKRVSSELGNGAVGLGPFHLYEADCVPRHDIAGSSTGIFEGDVNDGTPIQARFFGPIRLAEGETSWSDVLSVKCRPFGANPCTWSDVTIAFVRAGPSPSATDALARRTITITRVSGFNVSPGIYVLQPAHEEAIVCDDLALEKAAVWPIVCESGYDTPGYVFVVYGDCDDDDVPDHLDSNTSTCVPDCHLADFDTSGSVTVQDLFDFLDHYFGGCLGFSNPSTSCYRSADVNNSGGISVQDIFTYLAAFFAGPC